MRHILIVAAILAATLGGQAPAVRQRIGREELIRTIQTISKQQDNDRSRSEKILVEAIRQKRLAFPVASDTEQELRAAGASPDVLAAAAESQLTAADLFPTQSAATRLTKDALLQVVASISAQKTSGERSLIEQRVLTYLQVRRVDFVVTPDVERQLSRAGASARLIGTVKTIQLSAVDMLQAAQRDLQAGRFAQAAQEAETAAAIQPSLEALQLLSNAKAQAGDTEGSRAASLRALSAGGEITIPVLLAPSGENFRKTCDAKLVIGGKRASLVPSTGEPECRASEIDSAALVDAGPNEYVGKDRQAFHVLVRSSQDTLVNLCVAPTNGDNKWALEVLATAAKP